MQAFLDELRANGWIVKPTEKLDRTTPAQFFPRKGRFYCDPSRMTILDMLHERKHLELFQQRGNWKTGGGQIWRDELEAYQFEYELGRQHGFCREYLDYLERQIAFDRGQLFPEASGESRPAADAP